MVALRPSKMMTSIAHTLYISHAQERLRNGNKHQRNSQIPWMMVTVILCPQLALSERQDICWSAEGHYASPEAMVRKPSVILLSSIIFCQALWELTGSKYSVAAIFCDCHSYFNTFLSTISPFFKDSHFQNYGLLHLVGSAGVHGKRLLLVLIYSKERVGVFIFS